MIGPGPQFIDVGHGSLFAMVHMSASPPRMVVVWCPPMLHEHPTSVRLFSLLCEALAGRGVASVRLDYRGCGDSPGSSSSLSLSSAVEDALATLEWVERRMPGVAPMMAGARAGAFAAAPVATARSLPLMLWQPISSGAQWLRELHHLDARERFSTHRFPFLHASDLAEVPGDCLMGFRTSQRLRKELMDAILPADGIGILVDVAQGRPDTNPASVGFIELPTALGAWPGQIDAPGRFPARDIAQVAEAFSDRLHWLAREAA